MELWRHIPLGTTVCHQPVSTLGILVLAIAWSGKSKVVYQQFIISIKENIFSLEVSMGNVILVATIKALDQLLKEISANSFWEASVF